jgi:hypothetical protein
MDTTPEIIARIKADLARYHGQRVILRSRFCYVAHIDHFNVSEQGIQIQGQLIRMIYAEADEQTERMLARLPETCDWGASWDIILLPKPGAIYAYYASWAIFHDRELLNNVFAILDGEPESLSANRRALRLLDAWE